MKLVSVDVNASEMNQVRIELADKVFVNMSLDYAKRYYPDLFPRSEAPRVLTHFKVTRERCIELRAMLVDKFKQRFPDVDLTRTLNCGIELNTRMRSTLGRAHYGEANKIELHVRALDGHESQFESTFAHELAHMISVNAFGAAGRGHGKMWKLTMRTLGYEPKRCHNHDVSEFRRTMTRVTAVCGCREHKISKQRATKVLNGRRYLCVHCKVAIKLKDGAQ